MTALIDEIKALCAEEGELISTIVIAQQRLIEVRARIHSYHSAPRQARQAYHPTPSDPWARFTEMLSTTHRRFLAFVKANGNPTLEEIVSGLGLPSANSVGGIVRAIDLHATRSGFANGEVFARDVRGVRPHKVIRYVAGPVLLAGVMP